MATDLDEMGVVKEMELEPDAHRMHAALQELVRARTTLRAARLELALYQAEIDLQKPKSPSARMVGIDAQSKARLRALHEDIAVAEEAFEQAEADVKFEDYLKDMAKMRSYKSRF